MTYPTTSPSDLKGVLSGLATPHTASQVLSALNGSPLLKNFGGMVNVQYQATSGPVTVDVSKSQVLVGAADVVLGPIKSTGGPIVVVAGKGDYVEVAGNQADTIIGAAGSTIFGNKGADSIVGGAGKETLNSGGGHDTITAGSGADMIYAGGQSSIVAGAGHDTITSGGMDTITLGKGDVTLNLDKGANDTIFGSASTGSLTLNKASTDVDLTKSGTNADGTQHIVFTSGAAITTAVGVNVVYTDHTAPKLS